MAAGTLRWLHRDTTGVDLNEVVLGAFTVARMGSFGEGAAGVATLRNFIVGVVAQMSRLGGHPPAYMGEPREGGSQDILIRVAPSSRTDHLDWQKALANGVIAMAVGEKGDVSTLPTPLPGTIAIVQTVDGEPAVMSTEAAIGTLGVALVAGAAVIVAGMLAGAVIYDTATEAELTARKMDADTKRRQLKETLASASEVVSNHLNREESSASSLEWSKGELLYLEQLNKSISELTGWKPPPLTTVPDVKRVTTATGKAIEDVGKGVRAAGEATGIGLGVALVVGALVLAATD